MNTLAENNSEIHNGTPFGIIHSNLVLVTKATQAEDLEKQDLFINSTLTQLDRSILWKMFRKGIIEHYGLYLNLATMKVNPIGMSTPKYRLLLFDQHKASPFMGFVRISGLHYGLSLSKRFTD